MNAPDFERWRHEQPPDLWPEIRRRLDLGADGGEAVVVRPEPGPGRAVRFAIAIVVLALVAWGGFGLLTLLRGGQQPRPAATLGRGITRIEVDGPPGPIAVGAGATWVRIGSDGGSEQLWRIDARTREAKRVPGVAGVQWPAAGLEGVWVGLCPQGAGSGCPGGIIVRVDPVTLRVLAEIPTPEPFDIVTGGGYVWAVVGDWRAPLLKIDPTTNRIVDRLACCQSILSFGEGAVWARDLGRLVKIDPATGEPVARSRLRDPADDRPVTLCQLAAGEGAVWVTPCRLVGANVLLRVDPATLEVTGRVPLEGPSKLAVGGGSVWIAQGSLDGDGDTLKLFRVDPSTLEIEEFVDLSSGERPKFAIRSLVPHARPVFLDAGEGAVWVADWAWGEVIHVGPE